MKKKLFVCLLIIVSLLITKNVNAETYEGEYSVEYLLKNYSVVSLGVKDNNAPPELLQSGNNTQLYKGDMINLTNIDGAILVNGNYTSQRNATFGSQAGNTKSFIKGTKGNNVTTPSTLVTDPNYIDFNKLYENVLLTSEKLINSTEYHLQGIYLEVSKPGIYTVDNIATKKLTYYGNNDYSHDGTNNIIIKNYDKNSLYVFNFYNEYIQDLPGITIMESGAYNSVELNEFIESGKYSGNIIFNFPYAKIINLGSPGISGHLIAPNAIVNINNNYQRYGYYNNYYNYINNYYGTIIANTVNAYYYYENSIIKTNYTINNSILKENERYIEKAKDYTDDYYTRDYSIIDLLQNYNLITLGHKQINSKSKILNYGNKPGSIKLFHIIGQTLISGDVLSKIYENEIDEMSTYGYYTYEYKKFDKTALDLESKEVTESFIKGNVLIEVPYVERHNSYAYNYTSNQMVPRPQSWDSMTNDNKIYTGYKNTLFSNPYGNMPSINNYINFNRLYNNVVAEQSGIEAGKTLTVGSDGVLHIPIGENYTIEDISNVKEIVFDNFEKNKDELTIITIKNGGEINFPLVSKDGNDYKGIVTNDYFGKEKATHRYELDTFLSEDSYYGNIVWSLPNADYIKLKENAPFAGHMIAPNADVETPELHFAGCFIVNSIYGEGNTEAHFYPISDLPCYSSEYDALSQTQKKRFNKYRLRKLLGGDNTTIEKEIVGNQDEYNKDIALFESLVGKCDNREIIVNPKTAGTIAIILGLLTIGSITLIAARKANKSN